MGIINTSPDSFYQEKSTSLQVVAVEDVLAKAEKMITDGAAILDIGGMSTRPGSELVTEATELDRVIPVIESISKNFPDIIISIDTTKSNVAKAAIENGARFINDVSAGRFDPAIIDIASKYRTPYVLMHMKGDPATMQHDPAYNPGVVEEIFKFFHINVDQLRKKEIHDIILDPGFGFGKSLEHNYQLLSRLKEFSIFEMPILAGISRKSMICKLLKVNPEEALAGTIAANTLALLGGVNILRVHDVKEATEVITIVNYLKEL